MFELKPISKEAIPRALEKAERYRLLNEPAEAESICVDILQTEPENQRALVMLLLALTDRFGRTYHIGNVQPHDILPRLVSEYERAYYAGVIAERRAKAKLQERALAPAAFDGFREAMCWYEKASKLAPPRNEDAQLRWNTCARIVMRNTGVQPPPPDAPDYAPALDE